MRSVILYSLLGVSLLWAEPSVYSNVGSYNSSKTAQEDSVAGVSLREEIAQLREELEGIKSVVQGLSMARNQAQQKSHTSQSSSTDTQLIRDLGAMIDKINGDYVSKDELRKALKSGKVAKSKPSTNTKKTKPKTATATATKQSNTLKKAASSDLYSRGVRLVKQKKYSMAKLRFDILKKRNYKRSSTHFYLGEIAYRTKAYSDAVSYYQTSASANESASYMDTLLLHTALSLEKQGDMAQAKKFFQAIISSYPKTNSAREAKKHL